MITVFVAALVAGTIGLVGCDAGRKGASGNSPQRVVAHRGADDGSNRNSGVDLKFEFRGSGPIQAVCTTGMVADLVRNIGGERLHVVQLMREGVDPHLYSATPADINTLSKSDIIFYSGLQLEGRLADIFSRLARRKPAVAVTERLRKAGPEKLLEADEGHNDPHVWFDVLLWRDCAEYVRDVLMRFDPDFSDDYSRRADRYLQELAELDADCRQRIATIPEPQRVLVTAHDAFQYFGRAYGIDVKAIQGVSTDTEAGVRRINELVRFLTDHRIQAVFVESSVSDANVRSLIEGCAARGHEVKLGGELFSDAMGAPGTPEGTYAGMVRHNVETIVNALK